jgi:hypothetical protein
MRDYFKPLSRWTDACEVTCRHAALTIYQRVIMTIAP